MKFLKVSDIGALLVGQALALVSTAAWVYASWLWLAAVRPFN